MSDHRDEAPLIRATGVSWVAEGCILIHWPDGDIEPLLSIYEGRDLAQYVMTMVTEFQRRTVVWGMRPPQRLYINQKTLDF